MDELGQNISPENIGKYLPTDLAVLLDDRAGAATLIKKLPLFFTPTEVLHNPGKPKPKKVHIWECIALYYKNKGRFFEAINILLALYDHMVQAQEITGIRGHKGMPLLWISECYYALQFSLISKRYLMLVLIEDAITESGHVSPDTTGSYFRLVWLRGMTDQQFSSYAEKVFEISTQSPKESMYPEWILQNLNQDWIIEYPSPQEANYYQAHSRYINFLISNLGDRTGTYLEILAEYLLACMPGCRTARRKSTYSSDLDVICSIDGFDMDFRSEMGRYFICECKDWNRKVVDFTTIAKFCRVLDSVKAKFGILFTSNGISGVRSNKYAAREQLKVFQDRGMVIVVIDKEDLHSIAEGQNFINLLRYKYEKVRLDFTPEKI
jgi:hypothetical protein